MISARDLSTLKLRSKFLSANASVIDVSCSAAFRAAGSGHGDHCARLVARRVGGHDPEISLKAVEVHVRHSLRCFGMLQLLRSPEDRGSTRLRMYVSNQNWVRNKRSRRAGGSQSRGSSVDAPAQEGL
eukprot:COSAG06_NODE_6545_length_2887_cov_2.501793_5_plen_128_part_00